MTVSGVCSESAPLDAVLVSAGVLVIDQAGGRWCMLGRNGFTRVQGVWWWGSLAGLVCEVTAAETLAALDAWRAARADWFTATTPDVVGVADGRVA